MRSKFPLLAAICLLNVADVSAAITPSPRPGTVLWKRFVKDLDAFTPMVAPDGTVWVGVNGPKGVLPMAIDPVSGETLTNAVPPFSFPELRLKAAATFLQDGTGIVYEGDGYNGTLSALGVQSWTSTNLVRTLLPVLATERNTLVFGHKGGQDVDMLALLDGPTGAWIYDRTVQPEPPNLGVYLWGFSGGGRMVATEEVGSDVYMLLEIDSATGIRTLKVKIPDDIRPAIYFGSLPPRAVVTESGLIVLTAIRIVPREESETGVCIYDRGNGGSFRFVRLGGENAKVTGLVALRNGYVFASLSANSPFGRPGGLRGIEPISGQIAYIPDIVDSIKTAPVVGHDGTLYAVGGWGANPISGEVGATLYAIATGSRGGLAQSPWPRSTGDNLNSFREQAVEDSDGDGLTDEAERLNYHTNPVVADTDGDSYSDGLEVEYGSDPLDKASIPEIIQAEIAIKLSFGTNLGHRYQLQSSLDLVSWTDEGSPFNGTGTKSTQLVEASRSRFYWRLLRLD